MLDHSAKSLTRDPNGPVAREAQLPLGTHGSARQCVRSGRTTFFRRGGRAAQGGGLLNRRGDESRVGSNPTLSTTCARIALLAERRSYEAEVLGSIPCACTSHATLAQLE
jgi:hypothetical protein